MYAAVQRRKLLPTLYWCDTAVLTVGVSTVSCENLMFVLNSNPEAKPDVHESRAETSRASIRANVVMNKREIALNIGVIADG
jgi:hypothetical protein